MKLAEKRPDGSAVRRLFERYLGTIQRKIHATPTKTSKQCLKIAKTNKGAHIHLPDLIILKIPEKDELSDVAQGVLKTHSCWRLERVLKDWYGSEYRALLRNDLDDVAYPAA